MISSSVGWRAELFLFFGLALLGCNDDSPNRPPADPGPVAVVDTLGGIVLWPSQGDAIAGSMMRSRSMVLLVARVRKWLTKETPSVTLVGHFRED